MHLKIHFFPWYEYKTGKKELLKFGNVKIEKQEFYFSRNVISIGYVNIDKRLISEELSCEKNSSKYIFGYKNNEYVTPFCVLVSN